MRSRLKAAAGRSGIERRRRAHCVFPPAPSLSSVAAYANGSAVTLNGVDEYLTWDDAVGVYSWTQPFSGVARFKATSLATNQVVLGWGESGANEFLQIMLLTTGVVRILGLGLDIRSTETVSANRWAEVGFTVDAQDGTACKLWINGTAATMSVVTDTGHTEITPDQCSIGVKRVNTVGTYFTGLIAEVALAPNHTIDNTQAAASYAARRFANPKTVTTLGDAITHHVSAAVVEDTTDLSTLVAGGAVATGVNLVSGDFSAADSPWWSVALSADYDGVADHHTAHGLGSVHFDHGDGFSDIAYVKADGLTSGKSPYGHGEVSGEARCTMLITSASKVQPAVRDATVALVVQESGTSFSTGAWHLYATARKPSADSSSLLYLNGSTLAESDDSGDNHDVGALARTAIGAGWHNGATNWEWDGHASLLVFVTEQLSESELDELDTGGPEWNPLLNATWKARIVGCYPFGLADENGDIPNIAHATDYDATAVNGITFTTDVP